VFLVFAQACIRCFFWNALCCVDQDSLKRFYFFSDEFGSGETNGLYSGAKRNAAAQKRTAAAIKYFNDMALSYTRPKRQSLSNGQALLFSLV